MGLFGILPFMFLVVRAFAARIPLCVLPPGQVGFPTENCLCSLGSRTIINSLDPDNTGLERLVVYMYRNVNTGEMTTFIPNRQLQHQIPDFPEEYGTVSLINDDPSIIDIFDNSPSKDIREIAWPENDYLHGQIDVPHPGRKLPHGKKPKQVVIAVDNRLNPIHGYPHDHPYKNIKYPSWQIPVDKQYSGHNPEENAHWPSVPTDDEPYEYSPEDADSQNYPIYVTPKDPNEATNSNEDAVSENPLPHSDYSPYFYDSPTHPYSSDEDNLEHSTSDENGSNRDTKESTDPYNPHIKIRPLNPNIHSNDYLKPADPKFKIIRVPRKDNHGRIIGWKIIKTYLRSKITDNPISNHNDMFPLNYDNDRHQENNPFWPGNSYTKLVKHQRTNVNPIAYHKDLTHPNDEGYHEQVPSFDYWLKHQLDSSTINRNKLPNEDIIALHVAITNTLLQNGLIVTKHGTLIDGHGMVSSLDNLKLRPILMGQSFSFDHFIRNTHSDINFTIPPNSPTIEGLLLTMIKPAKILGIVPLSRSSVSQKQNEEVRIRTNKQKLSKRTSLKVLPISHLVSFRKDSQKSQKIRKSKQHSITKITKTKQSEQSHVTKPGMKEKSAESDSGKSTEGLSEEVPGFRIIGGMSATVSGTPLLNRGRSGFEYGDGYYGASQDNFNNKYDTSPAEQFSSRYGGAVDGPPEQFSSRYGGALDAD